MSKQFTNVNCSRGAPMGRSASGYLERELPGFVRLFKVRLDSGGYDDGGAYWGHGGGYLYCAIDDDGNRQFTRAYSRERAALQLEIPNSALKRKLDDGALHAGLAVIDGRSPMPEGLTRECVLNWMRGSGFYHDGGTWHA